MLGVYVVI